MSSQNGRHISRLVSVTVALKKNFLMIAPPSGCETDPSSFLCVGTTPASRPRRRRTHVRTHTTDCSKRKMQQAAALNELYRAAASKLNDGCRGVEGALRNATACQESLLAFDAGLRQLDDIGSVNNELFIRGRNIASRAVAYQMSVAILERTCEQAVMAHNRHRLVVASLLSLRCEAAARHLSLDRATLADNRRVVTRSMLMLGATVLPRHRIACAAADCHDASCALLLAAALDLCRLYGSGLRVALLGANAAARASVVQWACPGAMAHTVAGEDGGAVDVDASSRPSFSYFHLVHISQPASANGVHGWAPCGRI